MRSDEAVQDHCDRKAEGLAGDLRLLRAGVAREVGNVERERGPVADDAGEREEEEVQEAGMRVELAWRVEHGPKPPALCVMKPSSTSDMTSRNGAEKLCRKRIDSTPRQTTAMFSSQKPRKQIHKTEGIDADAGQSTLSIA